MKNIALLSLALAAGTAFAGEPGSYSPEYTPGIYTRAEVRADAINAANSYALQQTGEVGQFAVASTPGVNTRAEVRADVIEAVNNHALQQTGEVGQFAVESSSGPARNNAAVRNEARQASTAYTPVGEV